MKDSSSQVENMRSIAPEKYQDLSKDSLLCYAVRELKSLSVPATFENITVAAFKLFPEAFSLVGYLEYPDASRVNRTLLHARPKYRDLIVGNAKSGYALTKKGESVALQVAVDLESERRAPRPKQSAEATSKRTYTGSAVVQHIERSSLYRHWRDSELEALGDHEVWDFLEAMPYTDKAMLGQILRNYREGVELAGREDLVEFLSWVTKQYDHVFMDGEAGR